MEFLTFCNFARLDKKCNDLMTVLNRTCGLRRNAVIGGWRKLRNGKIHNLYSSPRIIRTNKLSRMRWEGHIARMGERAMHI
jgi:hypothetical protein